MAKKRAKSRKMKGTMKCSCGSGKMSKDCCC